MKLTIYNLLRNLSHLQECYEVFAMFKDVMKFLLSTSMIRVYHLWDEMKFHLIWATFISNAFMIPDIFCNAGPVPTNKILG